MKNSKIFLLFALLLCMQGACVKNTTISGTISDKATGLPIEGVSVTMSATKYKSENDKVTPVSLGADEVLTGPDGRYLLEIDTKRPDELGMGALKDGYAYAGERPCWGKDKVFDFEMDPVDAGIRVTIVNESGYSGKTYALAYEGIHKIGHYFYPWPVLLNKGESLSRTLKTCGDAFVEIRWGSQTNQPLILHAGVHLDSVFCPRNDTTEYLLKL